MEKAMNVELKPLVLPRLNINGTSKQGLIDQLTACMEAFRKLHIAMSEATPHSRDFQTIEDGEVHAARARDAWRLRIAIIHEIHEEISNHALRIFEDNTSVSPWAPAAPPVRSATDPQHPDNCGFDG